jgi:Fur family peroxide stress response transcriptional regulator
MEKKTKQKESILRLLKNTRAHPTADWVYSEVRKEIPNISLGTVYRNLKLLIERGDIRELDMAGTLTRYDACSENHYHFRCYRCGRVFDLADEVDKDMDRKVAKQTGFKVTCHRLEFRGLCHQCQ